MSLTLGYAIPDSIRGAVLNLPDGCLGLVTQQDAERIAEQLRTDAAEPHCNAVRARLLRLAQERAATH